jgi:hypothetical protein
MDSDSSHHNVNIQNNVNMKGHLNTLSTGIRMVQINIKGSANTHTNTMIRREQKPDVYVCVCVCMYVCIYICMYYV